MSPDERRQSEGREDNGAVAKEPGTSEVKPSSYPSTRNDDAIAEGIQEQGEPRSFDPPRANPQPRQGAGDTDAPPAAGEARMGPAGDPAEGKR